MMSGLGPTFAPPMEMVMAMVAAVDQGPDEGEHVMLPGNPALLRAVYAGGDPRFVAASNGDPMDLSNFRWDLAQADTTLLPAAQAQTIIKEIEWAKFFNNPGWSGPVTNDFGAQDRFKGVVMFALAKQQVSFALANLRDADGLFVAASELDGDTVQVIDATIHAADQYQMLQALSDLRWLLQHAERYNGVYTDPATLADVGAAADALFLAARALEPGNLQATALAAQAAAWYAAAADDAALQDEALVWLAELGVALDAAPREGVVDHARAARGLLEVARVLDDAGSQAAARADLEAILGAYDAALGNFAGLTTIADWEVGDILGALNSGLVNGGRDLDRLAVQQTYAGFFEATVNLGGLLQSVVPKQLEASPFELERFRDDLAFAYPGIPAMPEAFGPFGTAAVHASELTFDADAGRWTVSNREFRTADAMHTSNEMFWTFGLVSGFPTVERALVANILPVD
jgi:hypothetical protein